MPGSKDAIAIHAERARITERINEGKKAHGIDSVSERFSGGWMEPCSTLRGRAI